jgi:cytosine/adenosine deaminase-related metal-dependent hydrolase
LVERLVAMARERGAPAAMHLAESPEELELIGQGTGPFRELLEARSMWDAEAIPRGWRPLDYLQLLAAAPRALVIHGNYLAADEIEYLGQRRETMSVAFCPRTHTFFDHPPYPLESMLAAGVRVALGTDSRASNPDLSLLNETRFAAKRFADVPADAWVRMATLEGARALGVDDVAGSLSVGKRADLVAMACGRSAGEPNGAIVDGDSAPVAVWVAGERVACAGESSASERG